MQKYFSTFFVFGLLFASCSLDDSSTPSNNQISVDDAKELLPSAIQQVAYNHSAIGSRTSASIMQYLDGLRRKVVSIEDYKFGNLYFDPLWSEGYYTGSLMDLQEIKNLTQKNANPNLRAISLILMAHEYSELTFYFGDIPVTEALQGETFSTPILDRQNEVLNNILEMLDEAISLLGDSTQSSDLEELDLLYKGQLALWKKFAYGLKARILFHGRKNLMIDNQEILTAIQNSFVDHAEQAEFVFDKGVDNPQFSFEEERAGTFELSPHFDDLLIENLDPRRPFVIAQQPNGTMDYFEIDGFVTKWYDKMASIPLLSYTELQFMKAELAYYESAGTGAVESALVNAVTASMTDYGLSEFDPSVADFIPISTNLSGLNQAEILKRIIEQAYIAYFGFNHQQAWNNYKRTGFPILESTALVENDQNPSNSVPVRFVYPASEYNHNRSNLNLAIDRLGGDHLDKPLWVFK